MSDKIAAITVLSWNRVEYSKKTIENIIDKTTVPHVLVLVDNNSDESTGVKDYLSSITKSNTNAEEVIHVWNPTNMGVAGGRNSGIHAVESLGIKPSYIFNVDDDVLLPPHYDKKIVEICDKVPKVGLVGVSVEPVKYPRAKMSGVTVQYKKNGNLNGAALCMKRSFFKVAGYYGFGHGTLYGHEDALLRHKLDTLGLIGVYIDTNGVHLDTDNDKAYRKAKNNAHAKGSVQLRALSMAVQQMRKTGNVYTPYTPPERYKPVDKDIFTNELITKERK
jgi:glycosyltransferase involved in cell wall biosynthesis